ncbi:hypothetical protein [Sphingomonas sp. S-NIH.Pt15_0812]|uniref:hypothetical protein n=1 Tax=Sphingomonas sp. S-NIH.Pt15_0812 TaxID=1920129 RepID=UPI000F7F3878|nr:hypothetical protein [Sphingomonas sp. S-NIH.Pt15_0812]
MRDFIGGNMRHGSYLLGLCGLTSCIAVVEPASGQSLPSKASIADLEKQRADIDIKIAEMKLEQAKAATATALQNEASANQQLAALRSSANANLPASSSNQPAAKIDGQTVDEQGAAQTVPITEPSLVEKTAAAVKDNSVNATVTEKTGKGNETTVAFSPTALRDDEDGRQKFGGIEFGIGIAFSVDLGKNDRIREADIIDNVVRVRQSDNVRARLILESHYLFTPEGLPFGFNRFLGLEDNEKAVYDSVGKLTRAAKNNWGFGPFVVLQPGTNNIIDAIGAGIMLGLRRPGEGSDSFNIGLGVLYDIDARILGDGFVANQPPPGTETTVRFKTREQSGLLLMTSYTF